MEDASAQAVISGLVAVVALFAGSFAIVIAGLSAVGATPAQAVSGLMAASVAMGVSGIAMALATRMPICAAWSTPAAALLVSTGQVDGGFAAAVGAFIVAGAMTLVVGLVRPLVRIIRYVPLPLANAMLAGVLFLLCLEPVKAAAASPWAAFPVIAVWILVGHFKRIWTMPAVALTAVIMIIWMGEPIAVETIRPNPVLVIPEFNWTAVGVIALPMFIVTMASQNIPGFAVLRAEGYRPPPGPFFTIAGALSMIAAPFGGDTVNISPPAAALCSGPHVHKDRTRRYWAALTLGVMTLVIGLLASFATALIEAAPPHLISAVAGLALLGTLRRALLSALEKEGYREAALVAFVVTASGFSFFGVGAPFWGLVAGAAALAVRRVVLSSGPDVSVRES
ncbi:MAG: benzoate/H(+) symporter BenE family transporter [Rhodospirillales bacterium]